MSSYFTKYIVEENGKIVVDEPNSACFGDLFRYLKSHNNIDVTIFMYDKHNKGNNDHNLSFSKEEIEYVFDQIKDVTEIPIIENLNDSIGSGLTLKFIFTDRSMAYIKTMVTIARYFFESYNAEYEGYDAISIRDFSVIMRDSIEYSKLNPEIPFIEIFQLMHYSSNTNGNHTIMNVYRGGFSSKIISNNTFIENMNDHRLKTVYDSNGIFTMATKALHKEKDYALQYLQELDKIERI